MKKQLLFQKISTTAILITIVLAFVFSIGILTSLYETLYFHTDRENPANEQVAGANIYYELQDFNRILFGLTFFALVLCLTIFFTNTHKRRKYYLANYISTALVSICNVALSIWAIIGLIDCSTRYLNAVDFDMLLYYHELIPRLYKYSDSTFWFDICIVSFALVILASFALVGNAIWKYLQIKKENQLLQGVVHSAMAQREAQ